MTLIFLLLSALAFADDDITALDAQATETFTGPGVWMTEDKFRQYVKDSRNLVSCRESFDKALNEAGEANSRALRAVDIAREQFNSDEDLIAQQVQTIADLGAKLDDHEGKLLRVQQQRNVAWGIAGGFLAASTAAVVLTLSN
jgi:hypothetical protein